MSFWLQGLNPEQIQAVEHDHGPLLILAGAGSGKTTVLVARTGRMIAEGKVSADRVCVLTFTNKAARELKHRVSLKLGNHAKGLWAGTFHAFGLQFLRRNYACTGLPQTFSVFDPSDCQSILRGLMSEVKITGKDKFDIDRLMTLVSDLRQHEFLGTTPPVKTFDEYDELAEILLPKFSKKMLALGVTDFDGLLGYPIQILKKYPEVRKGYQEHFQQIMVDEFQDTNAVQMQLIKLLMNEERNLVVVGDDDQSIYGWRGAEIQNILQFPKRFAPCETIKLEKNYRSQSAILNLANHVIKNNKTRHGKNLMPHDPDSRTRIGKPQKLPEVFQFENEEEEADFIVREISGRGERPLADHAILYRSNSQGAYVEVFLRRQQINYSISGGMSFFDRKEVKDLAAFVRLAFSPQDGSLRRVINVPSRGIGDQTLETLTQASMTNKVSMVHVARNARSYGISEKASESLEKLFKWIDGLREQILVIEPAAGFLRAMSDLGYKDYLYQTSAEASSAEKRWQVVEIFSRILQGFVLKGDRTEKAVKDFLDAVELRDEVEEDRKKDMVKLMTLHACKGLEFPNVYLIGVEENLLPHGRLGQDVDEERRLFYVGITRAQENLCLSHCKSRQRHGRQQMVSVSRFLLEIPDHLVTRHNGAFRPVSAEQRESLVANFLSGLGAGARSKRI